MNTFKTKHEVFILMTLPEHLNDCLFSKNEKEGLNIYFILFFDILWLLVKDSTTHDLSAPRKHGILELKES